MTRTWKASILAVLVVSLILVAWFVFRDWPAPKNGSEALNRAIKLQEVGRYDKAVQTVQNWMNDSRRNISHDGFLYQQIAMIYIVKAYKKPTTREESIHESELNLEKSLDFLDKKQPEGIDTDLFGIGGAYEILGDLSEKDRCQFYAKARQAFVRQLPLIKGDSYTAYGKTVPLEPLRTEIKKHLEAVDEKYSRAACPVH
jgi:hypothetical protein